MSQIVFYKHYDVLLIIVVI